MTRQEQKFCNVLRSRGIAFIIMALAVWMMKLALDCGAVPAVSADTSVAFAPASEWIGSPELSLWVNVAALIGVTWLMVRINTHYNLLRTMSLFFAAFFMLATAATPVVASQVTTATPMAIFGVLVIYLMYSIYHVRASSRRVYLMFTLLSAASLTDYTFVLLIPVLVVGAYLMRVLTFKKLLAALLGLVTPLWIVYGLGLLSMPKLPYIHFTPPSLLGSLPGGWPLVATVILTMATGLLMGVVNMFRFIGFNARARAYNGFLTLCCIYIGVLCIVNFINLTDYVILLNATVAFQVGHFFKITGSRRGYIPVLCVMAAYIGMYIWAL